MRSSSSAQPGVWAPSNILIKQAIHFVGNLNNWEGAQKVQTSIYKINKSWACRMQHADSIVNDIVLHV